MHNDEAWALAWVVVGGLAGVGLTAALMNSAPTEDIRYLSVPEVVIVRPTVTAVENAYIEDVTRLRELRGQLRELHEVRVDVEEAEVVVRLEERWNHPESGSQEGR